MMKAQTPLENAGFWDLFTPKLVSILKAGYGAAELRADALAGLTVAIVALPLSMAIAIASGASPAQGLYTAIVGGAIVSALGGSRFQIGGPAGAFIVLVASTVAAHGMSGLILATFLSGLMLMACGFFRLGSFIRFVPFPVTVGFTAGIACIVFASQISELLGLTLTDEPGALLEKLPALWQVRATWTPAALLLSLLVIGTILGLRRWRPRWPGMLIAVAAAGLAVALLDLAVATIGTQFGGIPSTLPAPALPDLGWQKIIAVLPAALSFTLLGAIESLLSAVVADGMTGARHRSNCELVAQGIANMGAAAFGGFCVTGTIARTATNVRAGAHGPVAGIAHALFLLLFMLVAAPLASYIPLAALAGVLAVVAWDMIQKSAIATILRVDRGEAAVFLTTLLLTILRSVTEAIIVGVALGSVLFIRRMTRAGAITSHRPDPVTDLPDSAGPQDRVDSTLRGQDVEVYRLSGPLFFGVAATIGSVLDLAETDRALVLDFTEVPFLDTSGTDMIAGLAQKAQLRGVSLWITGASTANRHALKAYGLTPPLARYAPTITSAIAAVRAASAAA